MSYNNGMTGDNWKELLEFSKWLFHNGIEIRIYKNKFITHEIIFTEEGKIIHELTNTVLFSNVSTKKMFQLLMIFAEIDSENKNIGD